MKLYTGNTQDIPVAGEEAASPALLESQLASLKDRLRESRGAAEEATLQLEIARTLLRLERAADAWDTARAAFDGFSAQQAWQGAVEAAEVLFLADQPSSLAALGHGIWLAVTFPIDPDITVEMLRRVVEETPDDSDGAAVAAATAHYVADIRCAEGPHRDNLLFYTSQMLSSVARRHSPVEGQEAFEAWMDRLELYEPEKFLIRLRNVVDVLVQDEWWIDRDAIRATLPDQ